MPKARLSLGIGTLPAFTFVELSSVQYTKRHCSLYTAHITLISLRPRERLLLLKQCDSGVRLLDCLWSAGTGTKGFKEMESLDVERRMTETQPGASTEDGD